MRALAGLALVFWLLRCGGGSKLTPSDQTLLSDEALAQTACIDQHRGDRAATDACRAAIHADFDARWAEHFDGGAR